MRHRPIATRMLMGFALCLGLAAAVAAPAAAAELKVFTAVFSGAAEEPTPTPSVAHGNAQLTYQDSTRELCVDMSHSVTNQTAAHIHGPATVQEPAGILFDLGVGTPRNVCFSPLTDQQRRWLRTGLLYINVHSTAFPAGEIRGQIFPVRGITYQAEEETAPE